MSLLEWSELEVQILQNTPILKYSFRDTPAPSKMKIVRDLGTLTFQFQNTTTSPRKLKSLGRSWHFHFSVSEYLSTLRQLKPRKNVTSTNGKLSCGNLPHVETLSSPDNYSFAHVANVLAWRSDLRAFLHVSAFATSLSTLHHSPVTTSICFVSL